MVSSIVPGAAGAGALGGDPRLNRPTTAPLTQQFREDARPGDRVEVSGPAAWSAARDSVRAGLAQVQQALAAAHEAQSSLLQAQNLSRGGSQAELDALLASYSQRIDASVAQGARLVAGADIAISAEPGAPPVVVSGLDLGLKAEPVPGDLITVSSRAKVDDPNLAQAAQRSLDALQGAVERLFDAARSLEAHQGFLDAAQGAASVANPDLDAEGARLLALQVRQGLASAGAIANVEPRAVLALFKA